MGWVMFSHNVTPKNVLCKHSASFTLEIIHDIGLFLNTLSNFLYYNQCFFFADSRNPD